MSSKTLALVTFLIILVVKTTVSSPLKRRTRNVKDNSVNLPMITKARTGGMFLHIQGLRYHATTTISAILKKYHFIAKSSTLSNSDVPLGLNIRNSSITCAKMTATGKLGFVYAQLSTFLTPLNLVYNYESAQVSQDKTLVNSIVVTRAYVKYAVNGIYRGYPNKPQIPQGKHINESELNTTIKTFLTTYQGVAPSTAQIQTYRNFMIIKSLLSVIYDLLQAACITRT